MFSIMCLDCTSKATSLGVVNTDEAVACPGIRDGGGGQQFERLFFGFRFFRGGGQLRK